MSIGAVLKPQMTSIRKCLFCWNAPWDSASQRLSIGRHSDSHRRRSGRYSVAWAVIGLAESYSAKDPAGRIMPKIQVETLGKSDALAPKGLQITAKTLGTTMKA